jgi:hypothetical protein
MSNDGSGEKLSPADVLVPYVLSWDGRAGGKLVGGWIPWSTRIRLSTESSV